MFALPYRSQVARLFTGNRFGGSFLRKSASVYRNLLKTVQRFGPKVNQNRNPLVDWFTDLRYRMRTTANFLRSLPDIQQAAEYASWMRHFGNVLWAHSTFPFSGSKTGHMKSLSGLFRFANDVFENKEIDRWLNIFTDLFPWFDKRLGYRVYTLPSYIQRFHPYLMTDLHGRSDYEVDELINRLFTFLRYKSFVPLYKQHIHGSSFENSSLLPKLLSLPYRFRRRPISNPDDVDRFTDDLRYLYNLLVNQPVAVRYPIYGPVYSRSRLRRSIVSPGSNWGSALHEIGHVVTNALDDVLTVGNLFGPFPWKLRPLADKLRDRLMTDPKNREIVEHLLDENRNYLSGLHSLSDSGFIDPIDKALTLLREIAANKAALLIIEKMKGLPLKPPFPLDAEAYRKRSNSWLDGYLFDLPLKAIRREQPDIFNPEYTDLRSLRYGDKDLDDLADAAREWFLALKSRRQNRQFSSEHVSDEVSKVMRSYRELIRNEPYPEDLRKYLTYQPKGNERVFDSYYTLGELRRIRQPLANLFFNTPPLLKLVGM